jgi:hypothetical protein
VHKNKSKEKKNEALKRVPTIIYAHIRAFKKKNKKKFRAVVEAQIADAI